MIGRTNIMQWLNEPTEWRKSGDRLIVKTSPKTDFWRITHYGFIRDTGHFYFDTINTDFVVEVKIRGKYKDLYDQAGIMLRVDEKHWIKTGIEYVDGVQNLSAVVTHDYSDWSVLPWKNPADVLQMKVERRSEAIQIFYLNEESQYTLLRMTYLPNTTIQVGVMCASPDGNGFEVIFEDYKINHD
jgi:regulation of enolase protein 1 (concanavalin A-like superfamily)